jgi:hypothetical protein
MSIRQAIADALGLAGMSGHPVQPGAPSPGQGWPSWVRTTYVNVPSCGPVADSSEWDVVLLLPALDWAAGDAARDAVAAALGTVGSVESAEPGDFQLQPDGPASPTIRYSLIVNEE